MPASRVPRRTQRPPGSGRLRHARLGRRPAPEPGRPPCTTPGSRTRGRRVRSDPAPAGGARRDTAWRRSCPPRGFQRTPQPPAACARSRASRAPRRPGPTDARPIPSARATASTSARAGLGRDVANEEGAVLGALVPTRTGTEALSRSRRDAQVHRTGPAGDRGVDGLVKQRLDLLRSRRLPAALGRPLEHHPDVQAAAGALPDAAATLPAAVRRNQEQRHAVRPGHAGAGEQVGRTGAGIDHHNPELAAHPRVTVGGVGRSQLLPSQGELDPSIGKGMPERHDPQAGNSGSPG